MPSQGSISENEQLVTASISDPDLMAIIHKIAISPDYLTMSKDSIIDIMSEEIKAAQGVE